MSSQGSDSQRSRASKERDGDNYWRRAGIVAALIIFAGFSRTYFLRPAFGSPALTLLLHAHAAAMTSWIALFITQTSLVRAGRVDIHRSLGILGAALALAIAILGYFTAVGAGRTGHVPPGVPPLIFMGANLATLLEWTLVTGAGIALRRRAAWHKRLMLLSCFVMASAAIVRLPLDAVEAYGINADRVWYFCLLTLVLTDTVRGRRIHPAFGFGVPGVLLLDWACGAFMGTNIWSKVAGWLIA